MRVVLGLLGVLALACAPGCRSEPKAVKESSSAAATSPVAPPRPARAVRGAVSFDGRAIAGAQVCAWWWAPRARFVREDAERRCAFTDAEGDYALQLPVGVYRVVASAREHLPRGEGLALRASQSGAALDFVLPRGGSARAGTVVDLEGSPAAGVRVDAWMSLGDRPGHAASARTDARGRFELWADEEASLTVSSPGYVHALIREADTHVVLPESAIEGRVIDGAGRPVVGARVAYVEFLGPPLGFPEHATRTDAEGRFRLGQLTPDTYNLVTYRGELASTDELSVELGQTRAGVVITLEPMLEPLRAQVVDAGGEPNAGCMVGLVPADDGSSRWRPRHYVWTDEEGRLDVPVPAGASFGIASLACPGMLGKPPYAPLVAGEPEGELLRIEVGRGHTLRARVVDAAGRPLVDLPVQVEVPESDDPEEAGEPFDRWGSFMTLRNTAITDAQGRFEIPGLPARELELWIEGWRGIGPVPRVTISDRPTTEATFTMVETARIELRSSEARSGQAIAMVDCSASREREAPEWRAYRITDERGAAIVEHAPVGSVAASLHGRPSCEERGSTRVSTLAGQTSVVELEAVARPKTVVRVNDPAGEAVPNAVVSVHGSVGSKLTSTDWWGSGALAITDASGRASFEGGCDEESRCTVTAARPGAFGAATVKPGHGGEIEVKLRSTGPLSRLASDLDETELAKIIHLIQELDELEPR